MYNFIPHVRYIDTKSGDTLTFLKAALDSPYHKNSTYYFTREYDNLVLKYSDDFLVYKPIHVTPISDFGKVLYG